MRCFVFHVAFLLISLAPSSQRQFANFTRLANCTRSTESEALACLRSAPSSTLKLANNQLANGTFNENGFFTYAPCSEGPDGYIKAPLSQTLYANNTAGVSHLHVLEGKARSL